MTIRTLVKKIIEYLYNKKNVESERKILTAHLLRQYGLNPTKGCLKSIICTIPLGSFVSDESIDKIIKNGSIPNLNELSDIITDKEFLKKLIE